MPDTICFVVGARPNFMKAAPVHKALERLGRGYELVLIDTGQHYDPSMSDIFREELGLPLPDVSLGVQGGSHAEQTARALVGVEAVLLERRPDVVVVAGDVNSTLAGALAAAKLQIPIVHIEAGLRSFDPRMPEEHNRRLTDHVSDLLLAHSQSAIDNLAREGIDPNRVELVGNTMIDTLLEHVGVARSRRAWADWGLEAGGYGLVTLHRPSLVDDPSLLAATFEELEALSEDVPLIFPAHPRTAKRLEALDPDRTASSRLILAPPLGYLAFLGLEADAAFVLTDSGGVQEETSALGVRCFTLRDTTERPVTVDRGTNMLLGARPDRIGEIPQRLKLPITDRRIPFWDGKAGGRAAAAIAHLVESGRRAP